MHLLVLSISCSVAVSVLLKLARSQSIGIAQAVTLNYAVAGLLCWLLLRPSWEQLPATAGGWAILAALGVLLPSIFLVMAAAVNQAGIVRSDAAQRLSLFLPLAAAFLIFGETLSSDKLAGLVTAIAALLLLLMRNHGPATAGSTTGGSRNAPVPAAWQAPVCLLGVWLGYGTIDILFKQLARSGTAFASGLLVSFLMAGSLMIVTLVLRRIRWSRRDLIGGAILGLLNFGNIYFYIRAHQHFPENPTLVFTAMNIGVISVGTLVGAGIFRERLSRWNILGIALALAAIVLLIPR